MNKTLVFIVIISCFAFGFCLKLDSIFPEHFPSTSYNFTNNPLDSSVIQLGRTLFYDPLLSKDGTISCASCHSPYNGFAHTDHDLSHGINDSIGTRNAPALFNLAWQSSFMWDGASNHLDVQALAPLNHAGEMGETTLNVIDKLNNSEVYKMLFAKAFNTNKATAPLMLKALAQFQLTLISSNSKYDKVMTSEMEFTEMENKGYQLFKKQCNSCHTEPLFSSYQFANNGLPMDSSLMDYGKGAITLISEDSMTFKIPSLRNLSYTYPYMHDGRFKKLNEVINHYTNGIEATEHLSEELKTPIKLSSNQKVELIAFLKTLNDNSFIFNPDNKYPKEILNQ
jgi:cytochrome c peroxidase